MNRHPYKHPKLYEAFDRYCRQWCEQLPSDAELEQVTLSPSLQEKMRRLLRRQKYGYYALFGTAGRRVASIIVALLVSMTVTTFSVKALRDPVVKFFTEVFETFTSVLFNGDDPDTPTVEIEAVAPAYIPEGFAFESETNIPSIYRCVYRNTDTGEQLNYTQRWNDHGTLGANTENIEYHNVKVNALDGIAYTQGEYTSVMFTHGNYVFMVNAPLPEDELLKIAASIPLK